jgi:hypothetical protein
MYFEVHARLCKSRLFLIPGLAALAAGARLAQSRDATPWGNWAPPNPSGAKSCTIALDRDGNIVLARLGRPPRATLATALRKIGA